MPQQGLPSSATLLSKAVISRLQFFNHIVSTVLGTPLSRTLYTALTAQTATPSPPPPP
jgi:hypothetical protein